MDGLLGGPKGMLAPPLKLLGGPGPPWPPLFLCLCNYGKFVLILHKNICFDTSAELAVQSDEGSQHMVSMRKKKNYHQILPLILISAVCPITFEFLVGYTVKILNIGTYMSEQTV